MKISAACLLLFVTEASAFSAYLGSLTDGVAVAAPSSYAVAQGKPKPVEVRAHDYLSALNGPRAVLKQTTTQMVGAQQQPAAPADYMKSLGGNTAGPKKSYNPFGSKPKATSNNSGYLGNLNSEFIETPSYSFGSMQQPTKTAPSTFQENASPADYMKALGGAASTSAPKKSYSPFGSKPKAPENNNSGYLGNLSGKAAPTTSYTPYQSPEPAASTMSYSSGPARAGPTSSGKASYAPFGSKPKAVQETGYLSNLKTSSTVSASYSTTSSTSYSSGPPMAGPSSSGKASYSPFGSKPKAVQETGYLSNLKGAASVSSSSYSAPAATSTPSYSAPAVNGPSSTGKASYSPFGSKPKAVQETGYLSNLKGAASASSTSYSAPAATSTPSYSSGPSSSGKASYSPFGSKPKAVQETGYLSNLKGAASASSTIYSAPAATSTPSYSSAPPVSGPSSSGKGSYSPFGSKPKAVKETGYLSALSSSVMETPSSSYSAPAATSTPSYSSAPAVNGPSSSGKASYSPFGSKPKAVQETGYLGNLKGAAGASSSSSYSASAAASTPSYSSSPAVSGPSSSGKVSYSPFGSKPKAVQETGYLGNLKGASSVSPSSYSAPAAASTPSYSSSPAVSGPRSSGKASYSPFGSKPRAVQETGYLGNLKSTTLASTEYAAASTPSYSSAPAVSGPRSSGKASYSPFGSKPKAVQETGYLSNLKSTTMASAAYPAAASAQGYSSAPAVNGPSSSGKASYSPFGSKPKAVQETGYLSNLKSTTMASSAYPAAASAQSYSSAPAVSGPRSGGKASYSPFGSKPRTVQETGYLSNLKSTTMQTADYPKAAAASTSSYSSSPSSTGKASYSPFGGKPKAVKETGYLSALSSSVMETSDYPKAAASRSTPSYSSGPSGNGKVSYSPFGSKPKVAQESGYLSALRGATMQPAEYAKAPKEVPAPAQALYSSPPQPSHSAPAAYTGFGAKPKAVASTGYLGSL